MFKKGDRVLYHTTEGTRYGIYVGQGLLPSIAIVRFDGESEDVIVLEGFLARAHNA